METSATKAARLLLHLIQDEFELNARLNVGMAVVSILDKWDRHRYKLKIVQIDNKNLWSIVVTKLKFGWGAKPPGHDKNILLSVPLHHPDSIHQVRGIIKEIQSNLT